MHTQQNKALDESDPHQNHILAPPSLFLPSARGHQNSCVVSGAGPEAPAHRSSPVDHRHSGGDSATSPGGLAQPSDPATQPAGVPACLAGSIPLPGQAEEGLPRSAAGQVGGLNVVAGSFWSRAVLRPELLANSITATDNKLVHNLFILGLQIVYLCLGAHIIIDNC